MSAPRITAVFTNRELFVHGTQPLRVRLIVDLSRDELIALSGDMKTRDYAFVYGAIAPYVVGWNQCRVDPATGARTPIQPPSVNGVGALLTMRISTVVWIAQALVAGAHRYWKPRKSRAFAESIEWIRAELGEKGGRSGG